MIHDSIAGIRVQKKLTRCTDFVIYSQNIDDVVHTLRGIHTSCIMAPEVKVQVDRRKWINAPSNEVDTSIT